MTKIVYNACFGGFSLSDEAMMLYCQKKGITVYPQRESYHTVFWTVPENERSNTSGRHTIYEGDIARDDPVLAEVVEELGDKANGLCAELVVEDLPKGTFYRITEYDGFERIETNDDIEWRVA